MNKKHAIKVLSATAVAATAFVATSPADASVQTDAQKLVNQAKNAGTVLKWAISTEGSADGTTRPWAQYNAAKAARDKAVAAVNKLPASQKAGYLADLEANVNLHITRAMYYIDAITAGEKIKAKQDVLSAQIAKGAINDATETAYHELSKEIRKQAVLLDRVYGKSTRDEIRGQYKQAAEAVRDSALYAVTVKMELDLAADALENNKMAEVEKHLAEANKYIGKVQNAAMKTTLTKIIGEIEAELTPAVKSVSAINAKEVVVSFNTALAEGTTEADLLAAFTYGTKTDSKAVLSKDGKTVTFTVDSTEVSNAKVTVAALDTVKKDSKGAVIKTEEYNTLLSFNDTTAPAVASVDAKGTTSVITFTEPVQTAGTVSLNGVELAAAGYDLSADGKTLTVKNLEAEKSYKVDIVSATDFSGNIANPLAVNFTVAKPTVDNTKPAVTSSVNGTEITLDFSEELALQDLDADSTAAEFAKVTVGGSVYYLTAANQHAADATKFTVDAASALGTSTFVNTSVTVEGFKDAANNAGDAFTFSTTLAKDTTKPSFAAASAKLLVADDKNATTDLDAIYLTFNEPVKVASGTLTKKVQNGIAYTTSNTTAVSDTTGTGVDVDGNGKIEGSELNTVKLSVDLDANSTYTFELAGGLVTDLAGNAITDAITFNVSTGTFTPAPGTVTDSVVFAGTPVVVNPTQNNVFTLEYATDVTSSATNAANYTLGGQALPAGTQLQFVDGTKKVRVTLPAGSIAANGSYVLEARNVVDTTGNTLQNGKQTVLVNLKESIAPTATKVSVVDSKTFTVDFSEAIADQAAAAGLVVKIAGSTVTPASAVVSGGKLTVTTTADFGLNDSISVEFNSATTNLVDANGNKVQSGVVTK